MRSLYVGPGPGSLYPTLLSSIANKLGVGDAVYTGSAGASGLGQLTCHHVTPETRVQALHSLCSTHTYDLVLIAAPPTVIVELAKKGLSRERLPQATVLAYALVEHSGVPASFVEALPAFDRIDVCSSFGLEAIQLACYPAATRKQRLQLENIRVSTFPDPVQSTSVYTITDTLSPMRPRLLICGQNTDTLHLTCSAAAVAQQRFGTVFQLCSYDYSAEAITAISRIYCSQDITVEAVDAEMRDSYLDTVHIAVNAEPLLAWNADIALCAERGMPVGFSAETGLAGLAEKPSTYPIQPTICTPLRGSADIGFWRLDPTSIALALQEMAAENTPSGGWRRVNTSKGWQGIWTYIAG